jgi:uncharacterized membrane protein
MALAVLLTSESRLVIATVLVVPLLLPLNGMLKNRRYTFKWAGFLAMLYFCIGVSESFANDDLRLYGSLTLVLSIVFFFSTIYYSRFLKHQQAT